ncbi:MAG: rane-flanked domain protein [Alphaproteobacteria bacterium]|nr:rane-flanked domain protein [Alphaproteobacteria bacterium]
MLYIQESLAPGEKILKFSQYHWIYVAGSLFGATIYIVLAFAFLFVGIIYHHYDIVKVPPWNIFKAASQLSIGDYFTTVWHTHPIFRIAAFICVLMAAIQVGARMLMRMTTEMGVTTRRVVYKRGLVSRKVEEMRVDFIDGADVEQSVMGRIFNFGRIKMYGTGVEGITFPNLMEDPVNFRRAVLAARAVQIGGEDQVQQGNGLSQQPKGNKNGPHADNINPETRSEHDKLKDEMPIKPSGPAVSASELKDVSAPTDEEPPLPTIPSARLAMRHDV